MKKTTIVSLIIAVIVVVILGKFSLSSKDLVGKGAVAEPVNQTDFDTQVPMVSNVKDKKGVLYGTKVKDVSKYALTAHQNYFATDILQGMGPTGNGTLSVDDINDLYYQTALKMGLTAQDIVSGVNLYEFIRK